MKGDNSEDVFKRAFVVDSHADSILDVVPSSAPLMFEYLKKYFNETEETPNTSSLIDLTLGYFMEKTGVIVTANRFQTNPSASARNLYEKSDLGHLDFPRMLEAGLDLEFLSVYTEKEYKSERAAHRALVLVNEIINQVEKFGNKIKLIYSKADLEKSFQNHEPSVLISFEGGDPFEGDINLVKAFYRLGVRCVGLTYNERNQIGDGLSESRANGGLTEFGLQVVKVMNELGMLIDVAHMSEHTFYDVFDNTKQLIIDSHANCNTIKKDKRNLTDDQLRALSDNGGVIGILFAGPGLLTDSGVATVDDIVKHISHAVEVAGISHVGLGSDFDGTRKLPKGIRDVRDMNKICEALLKQGFSEKETRMILGENTVNLLMKVLK